MRDDTASDNATTTTGESAGAHATAPHPAQAAPLLQRQGKVDWEERHRVVIVGSGVGGSITAFRLAEAGIDNLVLERGRRWPITARGDTFPHLPSPDKRLIWLEGGDLWQLSAFLPVLPSIVQKILSKVPCRSTGLLEIIPQRNVSIACGAGVGGTSLIYGGLLVQPRPDLFARVFPSGLDYEELDRVYYPRVRERLGAASFPEDLLARPQFRSNQVWQFALAEAGLPAERVVGTFDFDVIRAELEGRRPPAATIGQYIFTGCNSGAKLSLDRTYLARAEATGKTTVRPLHKVTGIARQSDGSFRVSVDRLSNQGMTRERLTLLCDKLVLAAGVHTPLLLVTARATGTLPELHESVGSDWGSSGDQLPLIRSSSIPIGPVQGGPPAFLVRNQDGTAMINHAPLPLRAGAELLVCAGMGISDRLGRWTYASSAGSPRLEWTPDNDATARDACLDLARRVARHVGANATASSPLGRYPMVTHPLGGTPLDKATDAFGRLHGYPGLYCLDGSLMPGSTAAVNPVLTIAAIVERCLDHIITDFTAA